MLMKKFENEKSVKFPMPTAQGLKKLKTAFSIHKS